MNLPNAAGAIIPTEKLRDYLLSTEHPIGRYKATFFRTLGYEASDWELLHSDIAGLLNSDAAEIETTDYGKKYAITGSITGPSGRSAVLVTVWIILTGEDVPRFVTAYPED